MKILITFQTEMTEYVPSLMNSIRMIHTISQYYNTSERMTSLFVKVTNQMISTCKAYINKGVSRIWDLPRYECTCSASPGVMLIFLLDFINTVGILLQFFRFRLSKLSRHFISVIITEFRVQFPPQFAFLITSTCAE